MRGWRNQSNAGNYAGAGPDGQGQGRVSPMPAGSCLSMEGALPFAWVTGDLSSSGVFGDPTVATVEKGNRFLASLVQGWVKALEDIYYFRQPQVRRP